MVYIGIDLGLVNGGVTLSLGTTGSSSGLKLFRPEAKLPWIEKDLFKKLKKDTGFSATSEENFSHLLELHRNEILKPIKGAFYLYDEPTTFLIDWSANEVYMRGTKVLAAKKALLAGIYLSSLEKLGPVIFLGPQKLRQSLIDLVDKPGNLSKEAIWTLYLENMGPEIYIAEIDFWNDLNEHERDSVILSWAYWRHSYEA